MQNYGQFGCRNHQIYYNASPNISTESFIMYYHICITVDLLHR